MGMSYGYGPAANKQEMISLIHSAVAEAMANRRACRRQANLTAPDIMNER